MSVKLEVKNQLNEVKSRQTTAIPTPYPAGPWLGWELRSLTGRPGRRLPSFQMGRPL